MLRKLMSAMVVGAVLMIAPVGQTAGYNGRFDGLAASLSGAVASGNQTAIKINNMIQATSNARSKDFKTLSHIVKAAKDDGYQTVSEQTLITLFDAMVVDTAQYGVTAFSNLAAAIQNDPAHATTYIKAQAKYIASQARDLLRFQAVWGQSADPNKVDLAKAAAYYGAIAKLYEIIAHKYPT